MQPIPVGNEGRNDFPDHWGYTAIALALSTALTLGVAPAYAMASHYEGYLALRVFNFRTAVYSGGYFIPLLVIPALVLFYVAKKR